MDPITRLIVVTSVKSNHVNRTTMKHLLFIISFILTSVQIFVWVRGRFSDPFVTLASNKRIKMNATTWIKIFQKSGSENRPLICDGQIL